MGVKMIGQSISHYKILEKLGEGGMGVVYKAEDTKLKRTVALKFLPAELTRDAVAKERFFVEARAAAALNHANIITVYETDEYNDRVYISMEYVPGENLKEKINSGPLKIDEALKIARKVAKGLQEAHEKSIIHRDIKSANIMTNDKGQVKIMDFGLARLIGQTGVTKTGITLGTADYMSPEQAQGAEVDHRTDIWALGIVLYEMVTGRLPFRGDYWHAVLYSIMHEDPEPVTALCTGVPVELERIINKALSKDPSERYQHAEDMQVELKALKKSIYSEEKPHLSIPFINEEEEVEKKKPVFVNRERELAKLDKFLETMLTGKGQVVFVTGEAGSGKTTLIQEFDCHAQKMLADLISASGKCGAHTGIGDPYLPFREIMSLLTGDIEAMWATGAVTREHATRLWNFLPLSVQALVDAGPDLVDTFVPGKALVKRAAASSLGETDRLTQLEKLVERKADLPAASNLQQNDLFEQFTRVLQKLSRQQPLLLVLDDLQWADAGSISLLFHLGRRIEGNRILVVGAYRPSEITLARLSERSPLESVVNELKGIFGDIELELGQAEGHHFVNAFIDTEPNRLSASFRETLYRQTEGHPLFTVELLRSMQEQGMLVKDKENQWIEGPSLKWDALPARVDAVIAEGIGRLPESLRKVLTLASVEGEEFTAEVAARMNEINDLEMIRMLSTSLDKRHNLVSARSIKRIKGQRLSLYRFRHVLFQKYLYNSLDEVERVYLHEEIGNVLEKIYGEQTNEIALHLARHFREAGITGKAVNYLIQAANKARCVFANEEALEHFQQALILVKETSRSSSKQEQYREPTAKILEGLGDIRKRMGRQDEARASYQDALAYVPKNDVVRKSRLHRKTGKTLEVQRRFKEALQSYELAESVLGQEPSQPETDWWNKWIEVQIDRIWLHYWQLQLSEMTELTEKVKPAVEQYGTPVQRAKFFTCLTLMAHNRERYVTSEETVAHSRAALSASEESGNLNLISLAHFGVGFSLLWHGDFDEAEQQMQTALKLAERTGDIVLQSRCLAYLTLLYRKCGQVKKVRQYIPRCHTTATSAQLTEYITFAKANLAWAEWREGKLAEAEANGRAALESWQKELVGHGSSVLQWTALWPLLGVAHAQNKFSDAVEFARILLEPTQLPPLPNTLAAILKKAVNTWQKGDKKLTRAKLNQAIESAREIGCL
jgi:serine/threonine protein kinase/tetratricopeptide (TPR) repeat protein